MEKDTYEMCVFFIGELAIRKGVFTSPHGQDNLPGSNQSPSQDVSSSPQAKPPDCQCPEQPHTGNTEVHLNLGLGLGLGLGLFCGLPAAVAIKRCLIWLSKKSAMKRAIATTHSSRNMTDMADDVNKKLLQSVITTHIEKKM